MNNKKSDRKCLRKQKLAGHKIQKDVSIKCTDTATKYIAVCNAGLVTGLSREAVKKLCDDVQILDCVIIMPVGKSYSFIKFTDIDQSQQFYHKFHGIRNVKSDGTPLYLSFVDSVPDLESCKLEDKLPPGMRLITDFVTEYEENKLLNIIDWNEDGNDFSELKHRKAKHFGYIFRYDNNKVDLQNQISPIPEECQFLQERFEKEGCGFYKYDQLTVNRYLPGQGIPPHIDTHSIFEDTILSLSLGSDCVMDFKKDDKKISVLLPQRSLLIMKNEARYAWSHGIGPRHSDIVNVNNSTTFQERGTRVSFTFRKVRTGQCCCSFPNYCDSKEKSSNNELDAAGLENCYVHQVYEQISDHFSQTRHKQWPNVAQFLDSLSIGSILLDIGCGNGKYLVGRPEIYKVGCDRSSSLIGISQQRGFEVLVADCLKLPYKNNSADAVISIAVVHHLSTHERRKDAIKEMIRVLRPNGRLLIYVWAKAQKKNSIPSAYLKYNQRNTTKTSNDSGSTELDQAKTIFPVHKNGTDFAYDDVFVPWKMKGGQEVLRYYHVFEERELEKLCSEIDNVAIEKAYYDQGNWCAILQKM